MAARELLLSELRFKFLQWKSLREQPAISQVKFFQIIDIERLYVDAIIAVHDGLEIGAVDLSKLPEPYDLPGGNMMDTVQRARGKSLAIRSKSTIDKQEQQIEILKVKTNCVFYVNSHYLALPSGASAAVS